MNCSFRKLAYEWLKSPCWQVIRQCGTQDSFSKISGKVFGTPTALYNFHKSKGGKIVNFAGYALPLHYSDQSIIESHLHTRQNGSIFDVSHMLQTYIYGKDAISCMESICTADIDSLKNGCGTLTVFTNSSGGILDDLIVMKINSKELYVVSNAAMRLQDIRIMQEAESKYKGDFKDVVMKFLPTEEQSLIAVQGPKAVLALSKLLPSDASLEDLYFMNTKLYTIAGIQNCRVTRCGYTGEDGVEISASSSHVEHITEALLGVDTNGRLKLAGLGTRDTLRIEAGLCLYGTDINEKVSPVQANLAWLVSKRRRMELNFPGAHIINQQLNQGVNTRRVGLQMIGSHVPPARNGVKVFYDKTVVGEVTSGCPSVSLGKNIAMGYITEALHKSKETLHLEVRGKLFPAAITKMPFIHTNYYLKKKNK